MSEVGFTNRTNKTSDKSLLKNLRRERSLRVAWDAVRRNARTSKSVITRKEVEAFEAEAPAHLKRMQAALRTNTFVFQPALGIKIPKGTKKSSFRPLVVAKVESRIIQRAVHDVLCTHPKIQEYTHTPHSFGGVKLLTDDSLSAVPAAIHAVLDAISDGAHYVVRSDIAGFFKKIPKSVVTKTVAEAVNEPPFIEFFSKAIAVELANMAQLRESAYEFPIQDIGVAQGNSLSPLLGNIFLHDFDAILNGKTGVRCIRYIDDFIILAPTRESAQSAFDKAVSMLKKKGMELSPGKTHKRSIVEGFEFLGIELANGFIRPSGKAQERLLSSVEDAFSTSQKSFRAHSNNGVINKAHSLLDTLSKVQGIMQGWGKHYRFCNDGVCFNRLDEKVWSMLSKYLGVYGQERKATDAAGHWRILGIEALGHIERKPFLWPKGTART